MLTAPLPANEAERLAATQALGILDTPAEERFDRVTRLATQVFNVPMASVSVIDADRLWFKSKQGIGPCQTPRGTSLCAHAILGDEALVVEDTDGDPRFADNPMVTGEPYVRFYAGQPLRSAAGFNVGTLCIADSRPRPFGEGERRLLKELARVVENELGLVDVIKVQQDLLGQREKLAREVAEAAAYVRSLLPAPLSGPVSVEWRYLPSSQLGGDAFGYHWLDGDHFVVYLLDVSGHGVGAGMMAASVTNVLRSLSVDLADPRQVLRALNAAFQMDRQDGKYFSIWYGVFDRVRRILTYASAGHPPALLAAGRSGGSALRRLAEGGLAVGMVPETPFDSETVAIEPGGVLHVFSDGAYEIAGPDGRLLGLAELERWLAAAVARGDGLDAMINFLASVRGRGAFSDDISILRLSFR